MIAVYNKLTIHDYKLNICKVRVRVLEISLLDLHVVLANQFLGHGPAGCRRLLDGGLHIVQAITRNDALVSRNRVIIAVVINGIAVLGDRNRYRFAVLCNL